MAEILYDAEIWERITDDTCPTQDKFPIPSLHYLGGYVDGRIVAVYSLHTEPTYRNGWRMHFMVLKPYRYLSGDFFAAFLALSPRPIRVVVPTLYRSILNFLMRFDFELYDINRGSYVKRGKKYDEYRMVLN